MHIVAVGLNHKTAPVELRERVSFAEAELSGVLTSLLGRGTFAETTVLSTCNRTEVYGCVADVDRSVTDAVAFLAERARATNGTIRSHVYVYEHADASRHLFRVACGIDSMVIGESQILTQVREAFEAAADAGAVRTVLRTLGRHATEVGKRARSETDIGVGRVSISSAAVDLAKNVFGDLAGHRVLVVGAGEMSELTLTHLIDAGVGSILVSNRTAEKAEALAQRFGGTAVPFERFTDHLVEVDIVITQTGSPEPILTPRPLQLAIRARRSRPLFLIDIAVPRDIDAAVGDLPNVFLFDIDDLKSIVDHHLSEREAETVKVEALISHQLAEFNRWFKGLEAVPLIQQLEAEFERLRQDELARLLRKAPALTQEQAEAVDAAMYRLKQKLIRAPIRAVRQLVENDADAEVLSLIREVYGLPGADEERPEGQPGTAEVPS